jgi:hypothetical protein
MMKFVDALRQEDQLTENGMTTNSTSLNMCVDLFFTIGAMRGQDKQRLISGFSKAFNEDSTRALKILFWARDVREGAGERQVFKDILVYLANERTEALAKLVKFIPEFGRWDDLLVLFGTPAEAEALNEIKRALLEDKNSLCAKWMPRKGANAERLRKHLQITPKEYRKTLVEMTKVVETQMCAGEWEQIEFGKLPSLASSRYQKAFGRRTPETYGAYIDALQKGEEKINAGAVYPYDIVKSLQHGETKVATEQWKALPNWMENNGGEMILPVVDVSGSMATPAGNNPNLTCMMVAISLGLYISERNEGPFKDAFITFHETPELQVLSGSLNDRYTQLANASWGMNTNLESVFKLVLNQATKHKLSEAEMPTKILILSDMEFDAAVGNYRDEWGPTAHQMIQQMYDDAGYKMPQIVFWNIESRNGGVPVKFDEQGTALISGFSPAIMKSIIGGEIESPEQIMDKTILVERYSQIH